MDPLIKQFANRWWPVQDIAYWRIFQKEFPNMAESMRQRAEIALFGRTLDDNA